MLTIKGAALAKFEAYADVPIIEPTGNNDGPVYNKSQELLGIKVGTATQKGDPTCASIYILTHAIALANFLGKDATDVAVLKAEVLPKLRKIMPVSAGVAEIQRQAVEMGCWLDREEWEKAEPGDGIAYEFGPTEHHIGMLREPVVVSLRNGVRIPVQVRTVEGNTMPQEGVSGEESNDAGRNGGIFRRVRPFPSSPHYRIWGFVRGPK